MPDHLLVAMDGHVHRHVCRRAGSPVGCRGGQASCASMSTASACPSTEAVACCSSSVELCPNPAQTHTHLRTHSLCACPRTCMPSCVCLCVRVCMHARKRAHSLLELVTASGCMRARACAQVRACKPCTCGMSFFSHFGPRNPQGHEHLPSIVTPPFLQSPAGGGLVVAPHFCFSQHLPACAHRAHRVHSVRHVCVCAYVRAKMRACVRACVRTCEASRSTYLRMWGCRCT